jgi:hypothetical protein
MMRLGLSAVDEFVADRLRERDIGKAISMNMPDLSLTQQKRRSSEPVRRRGNSFPRAHNSSDSFFSTTNSHNRRINLQKKKSRASDILNVSLQVRSELSTLTESRERMRLSNITDPRVSKPAPIPPRGKI